eukprot:9716540-Ditylum_brightwellii.AAC.2
MAFTTESLMGIVYWAIDTDWPCGLAQQVVVSLQERYMPQDMVLKIELCCKMNAIVMKKEDEPARLFEKISGLKNRYNISTFQIPTEDMLAMVLEKAPQEYGTFLMCKQRNKGARLTKKDL